jgi:hypothetical protein
MKRHPEINSLTFKTQDTPVITGTNTERILAAHCFTASAHVFKNQEETFLLKPGTAAIHLRRIEEGDVKWVGQYECSECGQKFVLDPVHEDLVHIEFGKHVGQAHRPPKKPGKRKKRQNGRFIGKNQTR